MARSGRKRDAMAERYACGKPKRAKPAKPPDQPHRKGFGSNPLAETVHGRYYLAGAISQQQWLAGALFARSRLRYRAAVGTPDSLRSRPDGHSGEGGDNDAEHIARFEGIRNTLGHLLVDLDWIISQDAQLSDLTEYRAGLDVLRKVYGV